MSNERVRQQPRRSPPSRRIPLQASRHEIPKIRRGRVRRLRRLRHTNGAHQARPIPLPPNREREPPHVELQDAHAKAPDITGVSVVLSVIDVGVDPLGAHVRDRPHRRVARIHRLVQDPPDAEVRDLDLLPRVDQEVRRLDVAVHDVPPVQVSEPPQDLAGQIRQLVLLRDVLPFERAFVHELQQDLDLAVVVVHVVALHNVRIVHVAEDLDLAVDLATHRLLVVAVDHLEREDAVRWAVDDLVDGAAAPAADAVEALQLRERDELVAAGAGAGGRRRRKRQRHRELGVALW